jgi:hypothetical protein
MAERGKPERLNRQTAGQLITVRSPLAECARALQGAACAEFTKRVKNPYYLGERYAGVSDVSGLSSSMRPATCRAGGR